MRFRRLHDQVPDAADPAVIPQRLVETACEMIDGCDWAAMTTWQRSGPRTVASTGMVADLVSRLQYDTEQGPCHAASTAEELVWMSNLFTETRWPAFAHAARAHTPVRSALSCRLTTGPQRSVLTLYARVPRKLYDEEVNTAALVAIHAAVLMAHAHSARESAQLKEAMTTNRLIGQATGILMSVYNVTEETAFRMLRATSNRYNRTLRDIAEEVKQTRQLLR